jgi:hypothetical protein
VQATKVIQSLSWSLSIRLRLSRPIKSAIALAVTLVPLAARSHWSARVRWRWDLRLGLELLTVSLHLQMALRSSLKMIANASEGVPIVVAVLTGEPLVRGGTV